MSGDDEGFLDLYLGNKLVGAWSDGDTGLIAVHTFENVKATDSGNSRLVAEALYEVGEPELDIDIDYVSVKLEGGAVFKYDYAGRRVAKTADGTTTTYCYDNDQVIGEYVGSTLKRKFIYGPGIDEPILMIDVADSNTVYYYHFDGLGSVIALSDSTGSIVEQYSYDVFGDPNRSSDVNNPYMFTGRRYDDETDLYYYRARYYSADVGRFMQIDPLGLVNPKEPASELAKRAILKAKTYAYYPMIVNDRSLLFEVVANLEKMPDARGVYASGMNLYCYVHNNPVVFVDPLGLIDLICMDKCDKKYRRDRIRCFAKWIASWCLDWAGFGRCMETARASHILCYVDCMNRE